MPEDAGSGATPGSEAVAAPVSTPPPDVAGEQEHDDPSKFTEALSKHEDLKNWSAAATRWHKDAQDGKAFKASAERYDREVESALALGREWFTDSEEEQRAWIEEKGLGSYLKLARPTQADTGAPAEKKPENDPDPGEDVGEAAKLQKELAALTKRLDDRDDADRRAGERNTILDQWAKVLDAKDIKDPDEREKLWRAGRGVQLFAQEDGGHLSPAKALDEVLKGRENLSAAAKESHQKELEEKADGQAKKLPQRVVSKEPDREEADELMDMSPEEIEFSKKALANVGVTT